ncbi:hypothetical protein HMPREF3227_01961 [Corynebacterium sp. CMW7794]|nr:hypothetical protein HMPREF3227_01961 [Corynebacterium sp. CMW7794]
MESDSPRMHVLLGDTSLDMILAATRAWPRYLSGERQKHLS